MGKLLVSLKKKSYFCSRILRNKIGGDSEDFATFFALKSKFRVYKLLLINQLKNLLKPKRQ